MIPMDSTVWIRVASCVLYVLLAPFFGGLLAGVDRRITARMQGRIGPPILQPFYDVRKLFEKRRVSVNKLQNAFIVLFFIFLVFTGGLFFAGGDLLQVLLIAILFGYALTHMGRAGQGVVGVSVGSSGIVGWRPPLYFRGCPPTFLAT